MAIQYGVTLRNAKLDAIETTIGTSPLFVIFSGTQPATCATANSGTVLSTLSLPSDWLGAASDGTKSLSGTWQDLTADASGTAGHFRIFNTAGTECHMQGTVGVGGSFDLQVDNTSVNVGQQVTISAFAVTAGNA